MRRFQRRLYFDVKGCCTFHHIILSFWIQHPYLDLSGILPGLCFAREWKSFGVGRSRTGLRVFFTRGYGDSRCRSLMHQCKFLWILLQLISLYDVEHRVKAAKWKGANDSGRTKWNIKWCFWKEKLDIYICQAESLVHPLLIMFNITTNPPSQPCSYFIA